MLGRDALCARDFRDVGRGLDAETRNRFCNEMLQEIAVVTRDLDDLGIVPQAEPLADRLHVPPGVLHPGIRVGREIRVVAEDLVRRDEFVDLHEETIAADVGV